MTTQDVQDRGDAARRAAGIDGTAGDAQDIRHHFVRDDQTGSCLLCELAWTYRKHIDRLLDCGLCYEEQGEEVHPHPECPIKSTFPAIPVGLDTQPLANIHWMQREALSANSWNPNKQAPPEHRLLATSILENGWTQPIVARDQADGTFEIVDGFHRWTIAAQPEVAALTGGLVPVVVLPPTDPATARMATVRHNRARGTHHVLGMAEIVDDLLKLGIDRAEIGRRLEMDPEEVERLADRGDMLKRHAPDGFNQGWTVG